MGGKLDIEVVAALDLDSIMGAKADSTAASGKAHKVMSDTSQVEQAT